jgi:hypothetical protein
VLATLSACADERLPPRDVRRLDRAFRLLAHARGSTSKATRRIYGRAATLLKQTAQRARRYGSSRKPKLSADCARELSQAIESIVAAAASECTGRGFCPSS